MSESPNHNSHTNKANETNAKANAANNAAAFIEQLQQQPLSAVAQYYASCLENHPKAMAYADVELTNHEQNDDSDCRATLIGFADRSLGKHIPSKRTKLGKQLREQLTALGIYKSNGRETLRGYVTEPIVDSSGAIIGIRGHKLDPHAAGEPTIVVGRSAGRSAGCQPAEITNRIELHHPAENIDTPKTKLHPTACDDLRIANNHIHFTRDDRHYAIGGLEKNASTCALKVKLTASRDGLVHMDALDLVKARARTSFIKAAASELYCEPETIKKDIGQLLLKLESLQAERIAELKKPHHAEVKLSEAEQRDALDLLRHPNLLQRIVADLDACGMVGEGNNKLAGYLAATSRLLARPLAIVIQNSSSAGKTSLMAWTPSST